MTQSDVLDDFHPLVRDWFRERFPDGPTEPQQRAWPPIRAGKDTLVVAPTGSGKTLTAFLAGIDRMIRESSRGALRDEVRILYISPLKALVNDIQRNLQEPLAEIRDRAPLTAQMPRSAIRSGDSTRRERDQIRRNPPHILNTTPESLGIMLTNKSGRQLLRTVETVIIDEIHQLIQDKRGTHLALSLARLDALAFYRPARIGLSATIHPIDEVAEFLSGYDEDGQKHPCEIVHLGHQREVELWVDDVVSGGADSFFFSRAVVASRIAELIANHRTTIVFVTSRTGAERWQDRLQRHFEGDLVGVHHGSLSRWAREAIEERLKEGRLKAVVCTGSLELGIDVGDVDLVCQIGSPKRIASFLQRVGRSGRRTGQVPKGALFPTTVDEHIEAAALVLAVGTGTLDRLQQPQMPLDVLAQHVAAETNGRGGIEARELLAIMRRAAPYHQLSSETFTEVANTLHQVTDNPPHEWRRLLMLPAERKLFPTAHTGSVAMMNGGTIVDDGDMEVIDRVERKSVGSVTELYGESLSVGDYFLLAERVWQFDGFDDKNRIHVHRIPPARVSKSRRGIPARRWPVTNQADVAWLQFDYASTLRRGYEFSIEDRAWVVTKLHVHAELLRYVEVIELAVEPPVWLGEGIGRSLELSVFVGTLREELTAHDLSYEAAVAMLHGIRTADASGRSDWPDRLAVQYLLTAQRQLLLTPSCNQIVIEQSVDAYEDTVTIIHTPFGLRINRALATLLDHLRYPAGERTDIRHVNDERIVLAETHGDAIDGLSVRSVQRLVQEGARHSQWFRRRWREAVTIGLAVLSNEENGRVQVSEQESRARTLYGLVAEERPDHPLLRETLSDITHDAMDIDNLANLFSRIEQAELDVYAVRTASPSGMARQSLNSEAWKRTASRTPIPPPEPPDALTSGTYDPRRDRSRPHRLPPHRRRVVR